MTQSFYGAFQNFTDGYSYSDENFLGIFSTYEKAQEAALKALKDEYQDYIYDPALRERYKNTSVKLVDTIYEFRWNKEDTLEVYLDGNLNSEGNNVEIRLVTVDENESR